ASWDNSAIGDDNSDTISAATVDFSQFGGGAAVVASNNSGTWTATYTLVAGAIDASNLNVSVTATDNAGNTRTQADSSNAVVDNVVPAVTSVGVPANATYGEGQNLDFTVNTSEAITVDTGGGTPRIALTIGADTVYASYLSGTGSSAVIFRYTVQSGDLDTDGIAVAGSIEANGGTLKEGSGNTLNSVLNSIGSTTAVLVDAVPVEPVVTDGNISISGASGTGGAYKIGDTVTATWNNTAGGDNNADLTGVTVDFSQFGGGAAVVASNSSGTWTATYTITAGGIDAGNRNVSITATNAVGPTTTADTSNAIVDSIAPTVSNAFIGISGATGTGGAYKIGDTVTASWDNSAFGDDNSDTISAATVNFSQFGGGAAVAATNSSGTWTATYTIVAGAIDT
ncbi:hypothetical protein, partial [Shewanella sp. SM23]|uniref:hypothetical protein n=1 Tax=Shewanella sp. SM23 TaxID=2912794 RepID=UPI0021D979C3